MLRGYLALTGQDPAGSYRVPQPGTSENAVKTQIWIAVSIYVLVAIVRKRLKLEATLYQILQILSLTQFEKTPILQVLQEIDCNNDLRDICNQLNLFDL